MENENLSTYFLDFTLGLWTNDVKIGFVERFFPTGLLVSHAYNSYIFITDEIEYTVATGYNESDGIVEKLDDYTIYDALQNAAEAWSMVFDIEIDELDMLLLQLPEKDLNAYKYIHIEDEMPEGENMDEIEFIPILEKVSPTEAKKFISETMRFLYKQEREFSEISEELK
ncbi:7408_t:CDS:2, partial [Funneliformis caledonium]